MKKIFLSYAREDIGQAEKIYKNLSSYDNIDVWLDNKKLEAGQNWKLEIDDAISKADNIIILLSENSQSKIGFIQKEIRTAIDNSDLRPERAKYIIPVRLTKCEIYSHKLKELHCVDMFTDWNMGLNNLIESILGKKHKPITTKYLNYEQRDMAIDDMNIDISNARSNITMYARVYLSNFIKNSYKFTESIADSLSKNNDSLLTIEHISTDYEESNIDIIKALWRHEDKDHSRWSTVDDYIIHLQKSDTVFKNIRDELEEITSSSKKEFLQLKRSYITNVLLPYSLLIIDKRIGYISFYPIGSLPYGTYAPTIRIEFDEPSKMKDYLLSQISHIDNNHIRNSHYLNMMPLCELSQ